MWLGKVLAPLTHPTWGKLLRDFERVKKSFKILSFHRMLEIQLTYKLINLYRDPIKILNSFFSPCNFIIKKYIQINKTKYKLTHTLSLFLFLFFSFLFFFFYIHKYKIQIIKYKFKIKNKYEHSHSFTILFLFLFFSFFFFSFFIHNTNTNTK